MLLVQEKFVAENDSNICTPQEEAAASVEVNVGFPEYPTKTVNKRIAVASVLAAVGLFLYTRLDFGVSLKDLAALALPYEEVCNFLTLLFWGLNSIKKIWNNNICRYIYFNTGCICLLQPSLCL